MPACVVVPSSSARPVAIEHEEPQACGRTHGVLQEDCSKNDEVLKSIYFSHVEKFSYSSKHVLYFINYLCFFIVAKTTFHHLRLTNNSGLGLCSTDWKSTLNRGI